MARPKSEATLPAYNLTVDDAAALAGVAPDTIRKMIARGEINAVKIGRAVRIPITEFNRLGLAVPAYLKKAA